MAEGKAFSGHLGFVLAAAASAIGLGTLWRFPPLAAGYGGGIFLITYLILSFTVGFVLLITEVAIGRKTGKSALFAYGALSRKWHFLGIIAIVIACILVSYYMVIGGWVMEYGTLYITNNAAAALSPGFFQGFIADPFLPVIWTVIFSAITAVVLLFGVTKGIQRVSFVILPLLIVLMAGLAVYCLTLPGGIDGLLYYIIPDVSKFSLEMVLQALGQTFFSLSLAMGIMVTYGSYLSKKENVEKSVLQMEIWTAGTSILAGLLIVPAVYIFTGGDMSAIQSGSALLFTQMPQVFETMGNGTVVGAVFFICVFFAALTSAISLFEVPVSVLIDRFGLSRIKAVGIVFAGIVSLALIVNFGYSIWSGFSVGNMHILEMLDTLSNSILMPLLALLTCIFVGWVVKGRCRIVFEEVESSAPFKTKKFYTVMIKFAAPVCLAAILIFSIIRAVAGI